jgi:hypothetical protein
MFIFYGDDIAEVCPCCTACSYHSFALLLKSVECVCDFTGQVSCCVNNQSHSLNAL